jgi:hypothetical protein
VRDPTVAGGGDDIEVVGQHPSALAVAADEHQGVDIGQAVAERATVGVIDDPSDHPRRYRRRSAAESNDVGLGLSGEQLDHLAAEVSRRTSHRDSPHVFDLASCADDAHAQV